MTQALPRCQLVPEPIHQVRFLVDGHHRLTWHFNPAYPRPFFYPLLGPAGVSLSRMGHPGAPNHDHHQSLWFAHADVGGTDFWSNTGSGRIDQRSWLAYEDGEDHAIMAVDLLWRDGQTELLRQTMTAILRPLPHGESLLELQSLFHPLTQDLTFSQSNFGVLALRLARSLSVHFGEGKLTSSEGAQTEAEGFGQYARWWDASGPVRPDTPDSVPLINGVTLFDHPQNPGYPAHWHVREDGWMGPSLTRQDALPLDPASPLRLRYLLHLHRDAYDDAAASQVATSFESFPWFVVQPSKRPHRSFEVRAEDPTSANPHPAHENQD